MHAEEEDGGEPRRRGRKSLANVSQGQARKRVGTLVNKLLEEVGTGEADVQTLVQCLLHSQKLKKCVKGGVVGLLAKCDQFARLFDGLSTMMSSSKQYKRRQVLSMMSAFTNGEIRVALQDEGISSATIAKARAMSDEHGPGAEVPRAMAPHRRKQRRGKKRDYDELVALGHAMHEDEDDEDDEDEDDDDMDMGHKHDEDEEEEEEEEDDEDLINDLLGHPHMQGHG